MDQAMDGAMDLVMAFGGQPLADGAWLFELGERWNGAFGGTNGGVLSALSVFAARRASGRRPASVDSRYLRSFRPGTARVVPTRLSEGRALSVLGVDVIDAQDRACAHSTVTLAAPEALARGLDREGSLRRPEMAAVRDGRPWPRSAELSIPMLDTFRPLSLGSNEHEVFTAVAAVWDEPGTSAEAACIAADVSVGPPVMRAVRGAAAIPNPDLSLRFVSAPPETADHLVAVCALAGIEQGLATTRIAVWQEERLLAIGVSTTTCLPLQRSGWMH
jgi:acyl-coenzyme A thioesterase PaaI-like protein